MRTDEEREEYEDEINGKGLAVILVSAVLIVALLAFGMFFADRFGLFGGNDAVSEYTYGGFADGRYALTGDCLAVASSKGVQLLDRSGNIAFNESMDMRSPAIRTAGKYGTVFDIGGTAVRVFDYEGAVRAAGTAETVIAASVNEKGYLVLCTEQDGCYGHVTVFDGAGRPIFEYLSGESRVLAAELSADCRTVAVLSITQAGTRLSFFGTDSEEEQGRYYADGSVFFDLRFDSDKEVTMISSEKTITVKTDGTEENSFDFGGKTLKCYRFGDDGTHVLALGDDSPGGECSLVTLKKGEGETVAEHIPEALRTAIGGGRIAVMTGTDVLVYSTSGKEKGAYPVSGVNDILLRSDGAVIAAKTVSAEILK